MAVVLVGLVVVLGLGLAGFGAFLVVTAFQVGISGTREWWLALRAGGWTSAPARIERADVVRSGSGRSTTYVASVTYTFDHGGRTHTASRVAFSTALSPGSRLEADAKQIVERFPPGARVSAFFDEQLPANATLERNRPGLTEPVFFFVLLLGVGAAFGWLGVDVAVNAARNPPNLGP